MSIFLFSTSIEFSDFKGVRAGKLGQNGPWAEMPSGYCFDVESALAGRGCRL
jgi:hypothetical protein